MINNLSNQSIHRSYTYSFTIFSVGTGSGSDHSDFKTRQIKAII